MGAEQPVKTAPNSSQITLCGLASQHGTTQPGISLFFLMLHSLFDALDLGLGVLLSFLITGAALRLSVQVNAHNGKDDSPSPNKNGMGGFHWAAMHAL
ncbi:hypothetical protein EGK70_007405 [Alcaligenes aquatilis]|uniref:hypothetical protein n=1 Tax=Alcaligenes aquatilis TaxID=323284 RepID=UPI001419C0BA|nr:hypothetical protein [Alcaligenes aquatilis]QXR37307.1 hypothetical protein EGK70_007405 [Alcaligenes aquatilis]